MEFKDQIKQLGDKVVKLRDQVQTEEATKSAFVMSFIQSLGYYNILPLFSNTTRCNYPVAGGIKNKLLI